MRGSNHLDGRPYWSRQLTTTAMVAGILVALPASAAAQEADPQPTVEERDRDAAEVPAAVVPSHTVRRGDTLWDLAGHYLLDNFRWPDIFEINTTVVEDPHWIYPGEVLVLPDGARVAGATAVPGGNAGMVAQGPMGGVSHFGGSSLFDESRSSGSRLGNLDIDVYSEPQLVSESDFLRAPFLVTAGDQIGSGNVVRKLDGNPLDLQLPATVSLNDVVVVDLGLISTAVGEYLHAVRFESGPGAHRMARSMGVLEVTEVEGRMARARVVELYDRYLVGDPVVSLETFTFQPDTYQRPEFDGMQTRLLGFEVEQPLLGEGDMVFLASGANEGVAIGDEFALFPADVGAAGRWEDRLATVRVVRVGEGSSTARLIDLRDVAPTPVSPARRVSRATR